jgi:predicted regulator of Ras-like GTPase activity (Roadblock/LC7/MglB family)
MDAAQSLTDLIQISSQIRAAVIVDEQGAVAGSTLADGAALAEAGRALLADAAGLRNGTEPTHLEAATEEGSLFVLRDGGRTIVAATGPRPTVGLVFYDLKSSLRAVDAAKPVKPKPKPRAPRKKKADDDA